MKRASFMRSILMMSVGLIFASVVGVQAAPFDGAPYTNGRDLFAVGNEWKAVFLYSDAADQSNLYEFSLGSQIIFQNNNLGAYPIGMTKTFSSTPGQSVVFELRDLSVPASWFTGSGSTNVSYYDFGTVAALEAGYGITLSTAAANALTALSGNVLVLGFEDRLLAQSDHDFNDLIFAFSSVRSQVPEPATMLLLGLGLVGIAGIRKSFKK